MKGIIKAFVIIAILAGGAIFTKLEMGKVEKQYEEAIAEIAEFDVVAQSAILTESKGFSYPTLVPKLSIEEIKNNLKKELKLNYKKKQKAVNRKRSLEIMEVIKKVKVAKIGEEIEFQLNRGVSVKGLLGLTRNTQHSVFIEVSGQQYRKSDIMPRYYYLFDSIDCDMIKNKKIAEIEKKYKILKSRGEANIEDSVYINAGYIKNSEGDIVTQQEYLDELLIPIKEDYEKNKEQKIKDLKEKHKLFNLVKIIK